MALAEAPRPTVVALRALGLGDVLTAVPALRGIRTALPEHRIVLAAPAALAPLVPLIDAVDELAPTEGLVPTQLPRQPEVAVNLHGRGPQSHQLLMALRPSEVVAFGCEQVAFDGPPWREDEHEVARWCRLVGTCFDVATNPDDLDLEVPSAARTGTIVVHPGAASASRRWPPDRFAALCRRLAHSGKEVVVTGSENEIPLAEDIVVAAGLPPEANLAGQLDLRQLAGLVSSCRLLISGDTGLAHLAAAYRRPSIVLSGPVSPEVWGPPKRPQHRVIWHGDGRGDPWGTTVDPALLAITIDEVVEAAVELLSRDC